MLYEVEESLQGLELLREVAFSELSELVHLYGMGDELVMVMVGTGCKRDISEILFFCEGNLDIVIRELQMGAEREVRRIAVDEKGCEDT
jgi:hypothetical protein